MLNEMTRLREFQIALAATIAASLGTELAAQSPVRVPFLAGPLDTIVA